LLMNINSLFNVSGNAGIISKWLHAINLNCYHIVDTNLIEIFSNVLNVSTASAMPRKDYPCVST